MRTKSPIYIVIGDALLRRRAVAVLRAHQYDPMPYSGGSDFLEAMHFLNPGIAVLDMHLSDMQAMSILHELLMKRQDILVVMTSAQSDIRTAVQTIKRGADDFLEQPFDDAALLGIIESTALLLEERIALQSEKNRSAICMEKLSKREKDVLKELSINGDNHRVAEKLNMTVRSVETYRSRIMRKCGTSKFVDAIAMCRRSMP